MLPRFYTSSIPDSVTRLGDIHIWLLVDSLILSLSPTPPPPPPHVHQIRIMSLLGGGTVGDGHKAPPEDIHGGLGSKVIN